MANKKPYIFFPIHNKYYKWYCSIVYLAKQRNWTKSTSSRYVESHHIIPKSLGGSDDINNLVILTPQEHYICHKLLTKVFDKFTKQSIKMIYSMNMSTLSTKHTNRNFNSKIYARLKSNMNCAGENHFNYGKRRSPEVRSRMSESRKGRKSWNKGIPMPMSTRLGIRKSRIKSYIAIDISNNITYNITNLKYWCIQNNLDYRAIHLILEGKQQKHKGRNWVITRV